MRWSLPVSLLLHGLVLFILLHNSTAPIEGAIVSVSLERPTSSLQKTEQKSKNLKPVISPSTEKHVVSEKMQSTQNSAENQENSPNNESAYDSGSVSVAPRVLKQVQVDYPQTAKESRIEGAVRLSIIIDEKGQVHEVKVLEGPGFGLNEAAEHALKQFVFSPAELHGQRVPVRITYVYRFKLESR